MIERQPGRTPRPLRRRTFVRDVFLLTLHLAVYAVVIGGILYQLQFIGYGSPVIRYANFDAVFWPAYVWGTLIAAQAGATVFQRRRFMGAVLGAMASVLLGTWVLGQFVEYEVTAIVFRSIAVVLIGLALAVSLLRRPPALMLADAPVAPPRRTDGPVLAPAPRAGRGSIPNVLVGVFALIFVLAGIAGGTFRALEVRGSGEAGVRSPGVLPFDGLSVSGAGELIIVPGDIPDLRISGDDNLLDSVDVTTRSGSLAIAFDPGARGAVRFERPLRYTVTTPSLATLTIGGNIRATIDPAFPASSLRVVAEDNSILSVDGKSGSTLSAAVRDHATVVLTGAVGTLTLETNDNGFVNATALITTSASVSAGASSRVALGETGTLRYRQSGEALIDCLPGTEVLTGSEAEIPQCGDPGPQDASGYPFGISRPQF